MYAIKDTEDGTKFCGFHQYVCLNPYGTERWNDTFPYWEGQGYQVQYYKTREEAEYALENINCYKNTHIICEA